MVRQTARRMAGMLMLVCVVPARGLAAEITLDDLVEMAVKHHPAISAREHEVVASEAGLDVAKWQYFPSFSVETEMEADRRGGVLALEQTLWNGGRLSAGVEKGVAAVRAARLAVEEVKRSLAGQVVEAYRAAMTSRYLSDVVTDYLGALAELSEMMGRRVSRGLSAPADLTLVATRQSQAQNELIALRQQEQQSLERLAYLVGPEVDAASLYLSMGVGTRAREHLAREVAGDGTSLQAQAFATNPTLKRISAEMDGAQADIDEAESAYWPSLFVRAEHERLAGDDGHGSDSRIFFGFRYALNGGLSVRARVAGARAAESRMHESRNTFVRELRARVETALASYRSSQQMVEKLAAYQRSQGDVRDSYQRMFLAGKRGWLDVMNILREHMDARKQFEQARVNVVVSGYGVLLEAGGLSWMRD